MIEKVPIIPPNTLLVNGYRFSRQFVAFNVTHHTQHKHPLVMMPKSDRSVTFYHSFFRVDRLIRSCLEHVINFISSWYALSTWHCFDWFLRSDRNVLIRSETNEKQGGGASMSALTWLTAVEHVLDYMITTPIFYNIVYKEFYAILSHFRVKLRAFIEIIF